MEHLIISYNEEETIGKKQVSIDILIDSKLNPNKYHLDIKIEIISIKISGSNGLRFAFASLLQLIEESGSKYS